ncbi:MAG: hypothetical protein JNN18_09515 [Rubrivivax sp.]|nr:hypothetical protein [Rubrivivax sp.]
MSHKTTRIVCDTTFLDDRDRFEAGEVRVVDADRAARFIAAGWAHLVDDQAAAAPAGSTTTQLDVHGSVIGQEVRNG